MFKKAKQAAGTQPKALSMTVLAAAQNIDNADALAPADAKNAEIHCDCLVNAEHYPIVGKHLLIAIKEVLGDAATEEILTAWGKAYEVIARIFIDAEKKVYETRGVAI